MRNNHRWKFQEQNGEIKGFSLDYDGFVGRDKIYRAFLNAVRTYDLEPYICCIDANMFDQHIAKKDLCVDEFERLYGGRRLDISFLDLMAEKKSVLAKLLDLPRGYAQVRAGYYGDMRIEFRNLDIETTLAVLEKFLGELRLEVPLGLIQKDYEDALGK